MQGTVGHWCAIGILALAAAYGIGTYFNEETKYEQMAASMKSAPPQELAQQGNEAVAKLLLEKQQVVDELSSLKVNTVSQLESKVNVLTADLDGEKNRANESQRKYEELKGELKAKQAELEALRSTINEAREKDTDLQKDKDELQKRVDSIGALVEQRERDKKTLEANKATLIESALKRIRALQREKAQLLEAINKKTEAIRRRASGAKSEADGKLLSIDVPNRFCVVDLGRINNVHRGLRFDVVRWRMNKYDKIATIEITKVGPSTSEAVILDEPAIKKICPSTGYVAKDPEERYSPYAAGENNTVVPLMTITQEEVSSMKESDPAVVGDMIINPLFEKDKQLKIAFAGEPVVYPFDVLKNQINESGAILQDKIDIDTDFLVLGRVDEDKMVQSNGAEEAEKDPKVEAYKKTLDIANQYGIPIIREVELYDYLRN